jgi:carboxypeptidase family protein
MYCGGNEMIQYSRRIRARSVRGTVFDQSGATVAAARIQVQRQGSDAFVVDITADENGQFRLPELPPGAYWLGISKYGFQLHVWDLRIVRLGWSKKLKPRLSVGT